MDFIVINKIPLKALAPYKAEDALVIIPTLNINFLHQLSFLKQNLIRRRVIHPSTNCIKRVLATVANHVC
jgi:hypothetical protein